MKLKRKMILILTALLLINLHSSTMGYAAIQSITVDEDEYNLYVDEFPESISESIYAKFNTSKSNSDDYYLTMPTDTDTNKTMTDAMNSSGISTNGKEIASMNILLYKEGDDDDVLAKDTTTILLPLPDNAQETPENISFYAVSGGKASDVSYSLVSVDDINYVSFSTNNYTTYGFLYDMLSNEDEEESEIDLTPTSVPEPTIPPESTPTTAPAPTKITARTNESELLGTRDSVPKTGDVFSPFRLIALSVLSVSMLGLVIYEYKK